MVTIGELNQTSADIGTAVDGIALAVAQLQTQPASQAQLDALGAVLAAIKTNAEATLAAISALIPVP